MCGKAKLKRAAALAVVIAANGSTSALAQGAGSVVFQPLNTAMTSVLSFLTGAFATTAATIAVVVVGYLALTSRIPWHWVFAVVIGVAFIFGGAQIVGSLTQGIGSGG
jgi:type IV secretion system protein VirB2